MRFLRTPPWVDLPEGPSLVDVDIQLSLYGFIDGMMNGEKRKNLLV